MRINKTLRLLLLAAALMALLCAPALAKVVSPGPDFYYLDSANVLSEALEGEIYFSNKLLNDACGAQIVVVTVDSTGREDIDTYAYDLFNTWGIGDADRNNGFLLLLAIGDDDYYARTGSGLDSRFSASAIKDYYDRYLEDDFAAKHYEAGVKKFFEAVFKRISDTYNADVRVADGVAAYKAYVSQNSGASGFGGYERRRRGGSSENDYDREDEGIGIGAIIFVMLLIILILVLVRKGRSRRRAGYMPPPPPTPGDIGFGLGFRPTRRVYHRGPTFGGAPPRSSSSRSSSRSSSFGGGGFFSGGGGSSRSSGFGGGSGGGGHSSGGGAGRGRH